MESQSNLIQRKPAMLVDAKGIFERTAKSQKRNSNATIARMKDHTPLEPVRRKRKINLQMSLQRKCLLKITKILKQDQEAIPSAGEKEDVKPHRINPQRMETAQMLSNSD